MISRLFKKDSQLTSETVEDMNKDTKQSNQNSLNPLKYPKPKILLLDLDEETERTLKSAGYFIETGSLGTPYKVTKSLDQSPVIRNHDLPDNYAESEVIIMDFAHLNVLDAPIGKRSSPSGGDDYWASHRWGIIDPRVVTLKLLDDDFVRILKNKGVIIIFADFLWQEINLGNGYNHYNESPYQSLWSLHSALEKLQVKQTNGCEINLSVEKSSLAGNLLIPYLEDASFYCVFNPSYSIEDKYLSFAENKFGESVCGSLTIEGGLFLIFPRIARKAEFLYDLIKNVLPEVHPELFPFSESKSWILQDDYELPEVIKLKSEIEKTKEKAKTKVEEIEIAIKEKRQEVSYLTDILTGTGDKLVEAVIKTLDVLGFKKVIDVDKTLTDEEQQSRGKMEDIQILDYEPDLLVEVKGVGGLLTDDDALAVNKYVTARMREWKKTEIKGLTIVNHNRHLPPLDRENNIPFRDIILTNAEENLIGLLTTWELYKLTRNLLKNNWKHENIKDIFYKSGKIECLPSNYEYIGKVERFIEGIGVVGIKIENGSLNKNDKISFETEIEFEEQTIESLEVNNEKVESAKVSDLVGIKTHLTKSQIKLEKTRVFRVN